MAKRRSNVVQFSEYGPHYTPAVRPDEPATVIILPIIRIERPAPARKTPSARLRALRLRGLPPAFVDKPCDT